MQAFSPDEAPEFPFEFERKFFVNQLPSAAVAHGSKQTIIQAYVFAEAGYAIRIRLSFQGEAVLAQCMQRRPKFQESIDCLGAYERKVLQDLLEAQTDPESIAATMAVKSPAVNGERYELETEINTDVAIQIIQRSHRIILKDRYSLWVGQDGWEFDVFAGENQGLIIAECERLTPVVDLAIPDFCVTEVTNDIRFSNDSLAVEPWQHWEVQFRQALAAQGPYFLDLRS